MNGFITQRTMLAICLSSGLAASTGCYCYNNLVDPCYPQRYNFAARREVCAALAPQVQNGHVLDQTMWTWYFDPVEEGKPAQLNPAGKEHLTYLLRRRPAPDPVIYLATATDPEGRADIDNKRIQAIENYIAAETAGRSLNFQIVVHNPAEPSVANNAAEKSVIGMNASYTGALTTGASGGGTPGAAPR